MTSPPVTELSRDQIPAFSSQFLDEFTFLSLLGKGGMGSVYLVEQRSLERWAALKTLHSNTEEDLRRLERESITLASLVHPNIVRLYLIGENSGITYCLLEYVEGPTLQHEIQRGQLTIDRSIEILCRIGDGLACAHERGVIHRDIKPDNILIGPGGVPKITDFGLAKRIDVDSSLTEAGCIVGTPDFIPPELVRGDPITPASDQYSLGVVGFLMLTGRLPFEGKSLSDLLVARVKTDAPPLQQLRPDLPRSVSRAVQRCLARNPDDRFPDVAEFVRSLDLSSSRSIPRRTVAVPSSRSIHRPPAPVRLSRSTNRLPMLGRKASSWRLFWILALACLVPCLLAGIVILRRPEPQVSVSSVIIEESRAIPEVWDAALAIQEIGALWRASIGPDERLAQLSDSFTPLSKLTQFIKRAGDESYQGSAWLTSFYLGFQMLDKIKALRGRGGGRHSNSTEEVMSNMWGPIQLPLQALKQIGARETTSDLQQVLRLTLPCLIDDMTLQSMKSRGNFVENWLGAGAILVDRARRITPNVEDLWMTVFILEKAINVQRNRYMYIPDEFMDQKVRSQIIRGRSSLLALAPSLVRVAPQLGSDISFQRAVMDVFNEVTRLIPLLDYEDARISEAGKSLRSLWPFYGLSMSTDWASLPHPARIAVLLKKPEYGHEIEEILRSRAILDEFARSRPTEKVDAALLASIFSTANGIENWRILAYGVSYEDITITQMSQLRDFLNNVVPPRELLANLSERGSLGEVQALHRPLIARVHLGRIEAHRQFDLESSRVLAQLDNRIQLDV